MSDKLDEYVDGVFAPYQSAKSISELKADLLADLHERFRELKAAGKDDAAAFELTIDSIGDIEQTVQEVSNLSRSLERQLVTRFDASDLRGSDFAGVEVRGGKFEASALRGSDFSHANLAGSSFKGSGTPRRRPSSMTQPTMCSISVGRLRTAMSRHGPERTLTSVRWCAEKRSSTAWASATSAGVVGLSFNGSKGPKRSRRTPAAAAAATPSPTSAISAGW